MDRHLETFYDKESVRIVVTDSGLGGLAVAAHLEANFKKWHPFKEVNILFVNALASETYFYNQMEHTAEKVRVFNRALFGMSEAYAPDLILIACNTLSVLYDRTAFSKTAAMPVVGIVEFGVEMIYEKLSESDKSRAVILGTPTTIGQQSHKKGLLKKGVPESRIRPQACPLLESAIQNDPQSERVFKMIETAAHEALDTNPIPREGELLVGLCCTHYQYAAPSFIRVFSEQSGKNVVLIDPNERLSAFIFERSDTRRFNRTKTRVEVVSQAALKPEDIKTISKMIHPVSPDFALALTKYTLVKDLFSF